jgi:hypothetical protein
MITLGYWRTRAGDKVRVICVDASGTQPIIALDSYGGFFRYGLEGNYYNNGEHKHDLIAPWIDPPKVRECWAVFTEFSVYSSFNDKDSAERAANSRGWDSQPTVHHMREVNPAREKAVAELVAEVRAMLAGRYERDFHALIERLDAAEGVK